MLKYRIYGGSVYSGSQNPDRTASLSWENNVPANVRQSHPVLLSLCPGNKAEFLCSAPRSPSPTGNKRRTSRAPAPRRWKPSRSQTRSGDLSSPSRCSSLLRALCFRLVPLFFSWENVFVHLHCHYDILTGRRWWKT